MMDVNPYQPPAESTHVSQSQTADGAIASPQRVSATFVRGAIIGLLAGAPCGVLLMALMRFMQYHEHQPMRPLGVDIVGACFAALMCGAAGSFVGGCVIGMMSYLRTRA